MRKAVVGLLGLLYVPALALAQLPVVDFEVLPEGQSAGSQIAGVSFTNATVLQSAASLNEAEYPPKSGSKVACDVGGPMRIVFSKPVKTFTAYVTHAQALTAKMIAGNGGTITQSSVSGDNRQGSSKTPNEAITLSWDGGFTTVELSSAPGGTSFTVDDITTQPYIAPPPTFFLDTTSLTFDYVSGRLAPAPMNVFVSADPDVSFTVATSATWIQAIAARGLTPASVAIAVHPEKFDPGNYYGTVTFTSSKNDKLTLQVTVRVAAKPSLYTSPQSLSFAYKAGGSAPAGQQLVVGALSANVDYFILTKDTWVKATPDYGTSGQLDKEPLITVDVSKMAPGHYETAVYVYSNEATNSPLTIPVVVDVTAAGGTAGGGN